MKYMNTLVSVLKMISFLMMIFQASMISFFNADKKFFKRINNYQALQLENLDMAKFRELKALLISLCHNRELMMKARSKRNMLNSLAQHLMLANTKKIHDIMSSLMPRYREFIINSLRESIVRELKADIYLDGLVV